MAKIKIGTFTSAAGAAETINTGFKPDYVKVINQNASTDGIMMVEWFGATQGDEKAFHTFSSNAAGAVISPLYDATATTTGPISNTGSEPSVSAGALTFSGEEGFIVDADFLDASDVVWYVALQSD